MSESYDNAIETNELIVGYCRGFQLTEDYRYIYGIHKLIEPTSKQVIDSVIAKAGLSTDLASDMLQDSYLRLPYAVLAFDHERVPVFITYWRRTLHNHLVQNYGKFWRHRDVPDSSDKLLHENPEAKLILEEIKAKLIIEISGWKEEKDQKGKAIALRLIEGRVFQLKEDQVSQKDLALELGIAGAILSAWELWLRKKIREEYG